MSFLSLTKRTKKIGPGTEPWETPEVTEQQSETALLNTARHLCPQNEVSRVKCYDRLH